MNTPLLADRTADMLESPEFLWLVGALVATLLLGAILLSWVERWRRRQLADRATTEVEQFSTYRTMFERGELTPEEYERIKNKEIQRLRNRLVVKPTPAAPNANAPPAQPLSEEPESPPPSAT